MFRGPRVQNRYNNPQNHEGKYPPDWDARRKAVYERDNYICQNCGRRSGPHAGNNGTPLHAHHHTPVSRGGWHNLGNLITVCQNCHDRIHGHPTGNGYGVGGFNGARILRRVGRVFLRVLRRLI